MTAPMGDASRVGRAVVFNLLFWSPFWLVPVLVLGAEQWPAISPLDGFTWIRQGIVFIAAMSAAAELCGRRRRFFYLAAGLFLWVGASLSIAFVAASGIRENVFTALTGIVYAAPDLGGLRFLRFSTGDLIGILAAALPFPYLAWYWRRLDWRFSFSRMTVAGALCVTMTLARVVWYDYGSGRLDGAARLQTLGTITDPVAAISTYVTIGRALPLARDMVLRPDRAAPQVRIPTRSRPLTLIVVVGESTTRNHMSLYGYCRDTTPALSAGAGNLFVFRDAISEVPLTVFALSNGLRVALDTPRGQENQSVFDVFNAAAFHTYWLSNQYDAPHDPVATLTQRAQHRLMVYQTKEEDGAYQSTYDEALLAPLDRVLASDPATKIIFLHTIGAHSYYEERTPPGFMPGGFGPGAFERDARRTAVIDAYDTAVRYADFIVSETIVRAGRQGGDVAVLYFSDHGDEVFDRIDFVGHHYPRATPGMVEIPLLAWLSPALRADRPSLVDALAAARTHRMDIRDISPLLFDIAGIDVDGLSAQRRPLDPHFVARRRLVGPFDYDVDPLLGVTRQLPVTCQ
jgi:glucan phosphoethanolaminetransferase (alkaline phosphatase superfamily)